MAFITQKDFNTFNNVRKKIVSLVPSQTELLYDLGLDAEVVGITKFCIHPDGWHRTKKRVGGTKNLHIDKIKELQPDLIIGNREENIKEQMEELASLFPVYVSDVNSIPDALVMIKEVGVLVNKKEKAEQLVLSIEKQFQKITPFSGNKKVCYVIWQNPHMVVGNNTFIHDVLTQIGLTNSFQHKIRYPETTIEEIKELQPDFIFLSSEPYPFGQKHIHQFKKEIPSAKVVLVDGEMFSWYGSRLLLSPSYFAQLKNEIQL